MSVYAEIVAWSAGLPAWQRDVLRRLTSGPLAPQVIDEIAAMCLAEANGQTAKPAPVPLTAAHVPAAGGSGPDVNLVAIKENKSVNALLDSQTLSFGPSGLTIIYGDNGAGKSGFTRILRDACQARGRSEPVLSNVYSSLAAIPSAKIAYQAGGGVIEASWSHSAQTAPELGLLAVFDTAAAVEFVEQPNAVLWLPGGLDLLERLAKVVGAVREKLEQGVASVATPGPTPQTQPGTAAFAFLQTLSGATQAAQVDAFALSVEEDAELDRLDKAAATQNPVAAAAALRQRALRLRALGGRLALVESTLGETGLLRLNDLRAAYDASLSAEVLLAQQTFGDSAVPGVGQGPWRVLWDAAEEYAKTGATPDGVFPSSQAPELCVLCQQPLSETAKGRLARFHSFVRADVASRRVAAQQALGGALAAVGALRTREASDAALIEEVKLAHAENGGLLSTFLNRAEDVRSTVSAMEIGQSAWQFPEALPSGWAAWLGQFADEHDHQAQAIEDAARPEDLAVQAARRAELRSRKALVEGRAQVVVEIDRRARYTAHTKAVRACATTGITRKAGELTKAYLSDALLARFNEEAKTLRVPQTVTYGPTKNAKGTSYQRVTLQLEAWASKAGGPGAVLSEGERRAVALAAFLAELETRGDASGAVLDDPVSSLDHERRNLVASRLVMCAKSRQVIVFTHDLVFVHMLKAAAGEHGVDVTDREIRKAGTTAGYCREKAPAKAMTIKALVKELNAHQQECATHHRGGNIDAYELNLTQGYGLLREAWERAVEELLFNQSVMRFGHTVQTQRLKRVHDICQADLDVIDAGMTTCSKWLPGHAQATAINEPLPGPEDLLAEIARLDGFVQEMRKRGRS